MKRHAVDFFLVAFCLAALVLALPIGRPVDADLLFSVSAGPIYIETFDLARQFLSEPTESAVIIFTDLSGFRITTNDTYTVDVPVWNLEKIVNSLGKTSADIAIMVHNHLLPGGFSAGDKYVANHLRGHGFRGYFVIYYPFSKKVRILGAGE